MRKRDVFGVMVLAAVMVGCGGGSGKSDVRAVYEKNIQIMDDFSAAMDKAANPWPRGVRVPLSTVLIQEPEPARCPAGTRACGSPEPSTTSPTATP